MMHIIFENVINLFQSVVVTVFLMASLGCKDKYNKKCIGIIGIVTTFIYLTVSNHIAYFESVGIYIYMIYSLIFSFWVLGGTIIEKLFKDRKSTRLNSSHRSQSRMPSSA